MDRFAKLVGRQYHLFDFGLTLGVGEFGPGCGERVLGSGDACGKRRSRSKLDFQDRNQRLFGAWSQPLFEVRPSDLVSATSGHNSDMASGGAKQFFIFAAHLGQDRF